MPTPPLRTGFISYVKSAKGLLLTRKPSIDGARPKVIARNGHAI